MKLVMTLLARNEADIVDAQIAYHLSAGVDLIIAMDNGSDDGTLETLETYADEGYVHLLHEASDDMRQDEWVTRMARMAATDFGADWVINSDADEFWWPRGGTFKEVLALVPERFGVVRGCWRHFVARPDGDPDFAERMIVRLCTPAAPGEKETIRHAHQKVAHRAVADVEVERGNHNAAGRGLDALRSWYPIEVLHFSIRSREQLERKAAGGWKNRPDPERVEHQMRMKDAHRTGSLDAFMASNSVSDAELERGLEAGTYAIDTRLRDALRMLRDGDRRYLRPGAVHPALVSPTDAQDAAAYAAEVAVLAAIDGIVRAEQRVEELETRLASVRTLPRR